MLILGHRWKRVPSRDSTEIPRSNIDAQWTACTAVHLNNNTIFFDDINDINLMPKNSCR